MGPARALFGIGPARGPGVGRARVERLQQTLGPGLGAVRWARQVHGAELTVVTDSPPGPALCVGEADALATAEPGIGVLVWTADCVPVAVIGPGAVAVVHAGWRGCAAGVAARAVAVLRCRFDVAPATMSAVLGPAISIDHYQVGPEVIAALRATGVNPQSWLDDDRVDLRAFLTAQLASLGVFNIRSIGPCTFATPELASFRRDGADAGRQWTLVYRVSGDHPERVKS